MPTLRMCFMSALPVITLSMNLYAQIQGKVRIDVQSEFTYTYLDINAGTGGDYSGLLVLLPTGESRALVCDHHHDKHCGEFLDEKKMWVEKNCFNPPAHKNDYGLPYRYYCDYRLHGQSSVGLYDGIIERDHITVSGPRGNRVYRIYNSLDDTIIDYHSGDSELPSSQYNSDTHAPGAGKDDYSISSEDFRKADGGDATAERHVGNYYYHQNEYVKAASMFASAAEQGDVISQNNLGVMYSEGKGVPQSYEEAYFWEDIAAAMANGASQQQIAQERDRSAAMLSASEKVIVQERAAKWFEQHQPAKN